MKPGCGSALWERFARLLPARRSLRAGAAAPPFNPVILSGAPGQMEVALRKRAAPGAESKDLQYSSGTLEVVWKEAFPGFAPALVVPSS